MFLNIVDYYRVGRPRNFGRIGRFFRVSSVAIFFVLFFPLSLTRFPVANGRVDGALAGRKNINPLVIREGVETVNFTVAAQKNSIRYALLPHTVSCSTRIKYRYNV